MARTKELRDTDRDKMLSVLSLLIRLDCFCSLSKGSKTMQFFRKSFKIKFHNALLQNSQVKHWSHFRGSIEPKILSKRAPFNGRTYAEKYMEKWREICFKEQKECLERK